MTWSEIALICVGAVLVVVVLAWIISAIVKHKSTSEQRVDDVYVSNGTRFTKSKDAVDQKGNINISLNKGDVVLERGQVYEISKEGILPGKYTVLSADENVEEINIRIGGLVKSYKHFSSIVLAEGDEISAVSANAILR
ncbi:MAG: hypothetical protein J6C13_00625 [Clostridia bacterium]|nr:hypothetical protein [Clostridia bacterium]